MWKFMYRYTREGQVFLLMIKKKWRFILIMKNEQQFYTNFVIWNVICSKQISK